MVPMLTAASLSASRREPEFRWAQRTGTPLQPSRRERWVWHTNTATTLRARAGSLTISIPLLGATVEAATLEPEGALGLALRDRDGADYGLQLQLLAPVNVTSGWWRVLPREVLLAVQKRESGPYWRHLLRDGRRPPNMRIDWARWVDEARDGVRWNELADRRWEWWKPEKRTVDDDDDEL